MSADELEEIGPIDYLIIEWPDRQPTGEAAPILVDLVDRGLIRVISSTSATCSDASGRTCSVCWLRDGAWR